MRKSHDECIAHLLDDIQFHESPLPVPAALNGVEFLLVQAVGVPARRERTEVGVMMDRWMGS